MRLLGRLLAAAGAAALFAAPISASAQPGWGGWRHGGWSGGWYGGWRGGGWYGGWRGPGWGWRGGPRWGWGGYWGPPVYPGPVVYGPPIYGPPVYPPPPVYTRQVYPATYVQDDVQEEQPVVQNHVVRHVTHHAYRVPRG
jgi:hypothetical protein